MSKPCWYVLLWILSSEASRIYVTLAPPDLQIEEGLNATVSLLLATEKAREIDSIIGTIVKISVSDPNSAAAPVSLLVVTEEDRSGGGFNFRIPIRAISVSTNFLNLQFFDSLGAPHSLNSTDENTITYGFDVLRSELQEYIGDIFMIVLAIVMFGNTFIMGLQLDLQIIKEVLKRPVGPFLGFACQYGLMPLIAFGWGSWLLDGRPNFQFGLFAIGCSPGGGGSNAWSLLLDGNLDLSVTMTFFSNIFALAMMPAWIYSLGRVVYAGRVAIPFLDIMRSLLTMIGPIFLGILVKRCRPTWGEKTRTFVKFSSFIIILILGPFGLYTNFYAFSLFSWRVIVSGLLLPYSGFLVSYIVAALFRQNSRDCRTIAIETGIQNAAIAAVLLRFSLPKPESDLAFVLPFCVLLFTPIPLLIALILLSICKCVKKRCQPEATDRKDWIVLGEDVPSHGFILTDSVRFIDSIIGSISQKSANSYQELPQDAPSIL